MSDTSTYGNAGLRVGDTVRVKPYQVQSMSGLWAESGKSGCTAIVTGFKRDYSWRSRYTHAVLRVLSRDGQSAWQDSEPFDRLELVERGPGHFVLGQTHPFTPDELRHQRWQAFVQKLEHLDLSHQGFCNPATFLAWLYLNQEPAAHAALRGYVRKNGTINPNRVEKLFRQLKLTVDPWAFECPLDMPAEFSKHLNPAARRQRVDWQEVAGTFASAFA